ncbi:MAG: imidazoleglycerol-phosphate dehydratase, partial [Mariprofundus sp.]|nr:imidazoleglycerol-phosphate dehydratase [Mariprofundus sp.]
KKGIVRYGHAYVPLDEALSRVVLDFSGRPDLEYHVDFPKEMVGNFDVDLFKEFFQAVANHARISLHIDSLRGKNNHHIIETVFKAFGRALRMAVENDPRQSGIPSTKGAL